MECCVEVVKSELDNPLYWFAWGIVILFAWSEGLALTSSSNNSIGQLLVSLGTSVYASFQRSSEPPKIIVSP